MEGKVGQWGRMRRGLKGNTAHKEEEEDEDEG